jgi:hypothetical protein
MIQKDNVDVREAGRGEREGKKRERKSQRVTLRE